MMFIFIMLHHPNQENMPECHFSRSFLMSESRGGKLIEKISSTLLGRQMPKYLIYDPAHLKGKSNLKRLSRESGMDMFNASDF